MKGGAAMLIKTYITAAIYCLECDKFDFYAISRFHVGLGTSLQLKCQCGADLFSMSRDKKNQYTIELACSMCGHHHQYTYLASSIWKKELTNLHCQEIGVESAFLGSREPVRQAVQDFDSNMADLEIDQEFFNNEEIMTKILEKIEILDSESLISCTCGNYDIVLDVNSDRVEIFCEDCGAVSVLFAENIKDLEIANNLTSLVLNKGVFKYIYTSKKKIKR